MLVGQNNAGKSTIVEALRLISIVVSRYANLSYHEAPPWLEIPRYDYGVSPSLKNIEIDFIGIFHQYKDPPLIITAHFFDKSSVVIYLSSQERIHAVIIDQKGKIVKSRQQANRVRIPPISIMPQVAPVQRGETVLTTD